MQQTIRNFPESLLLPGEKVLWTGSPSTSKYALLSLPSGVDTSIAALLIGLGLLILLRVPPQSTVLPIVADLFSALLISAGCFMLFFPPLFGYFAAAGMLYAVTTERLLVVDIRHTKITRQYLPANLDEKPSKVTESNCVYFASSYSTPLFGASVQPVGFDYIQDAAEVAKLIDSTLRKPSASALE